jgi:hypothetical protein
MSLNIMALVLIYPFCVEELLWGRNKCHTLNTSCAYCSPARHSLSKLFVSLLWNSLLNLFPWYCASRKVYILWRVLLESCQDIYLYHMDTTYSMNLPTWSIIAGGNHPPVSESRWSRITVYKTAGIFSMSWAHSFLFCFTFYDIQWVAKNYILEASPAPK